MAFAVPVFLQPRLNLASYGQSFLPRNAVGPGASSRSKSHASVGSVFVRRNHSGFPLRSFQPRLAPKQSSLHADSVDRSINSQKKHHPPSVCSGSPVVAFKETCRKRCQRTTYGLPCPRTILREERRTKWGPHGRRPVHTLDG